MITIRLKIIKGQLKLEVKVFSVSNYCYANEICLKVSAFELKLRFYFTKYFFNYHSKMLVV